MATGQFSYFNCSLLFIFSNNRKTSKVNITLKLILRASLLHRHLTRGIGWSEKDIFLLPIRVLKPIEIPAEEANLVLMKPLDLNHIFYEANY